jgi:hypothetical protein
MKTITLITNLIKIIKIIFLQLNYNDKSLFLKLNNPLILRDQMT